jgi:hypothetical protein
LFDTTAYLLVKNLSDVIGSEFSIAKNEELGVGYDVTVREDLMKRQFALK